MLDEFPDAERFADQAEVGLQFAEEVDAGLGVVCAEQVPGEEAREVLYCAEGFVAADWRGSRSVWWLRSEGRE